MLAQIKKLMLGSGLAQAIQFGCIPILSRLYEPTSFAPLYQAQALALEIGNQNILASSLFVIAFVHAVAGKLDEATHGIAEALRVSREAGEKGCEGFNLILLGMLHSWKGEYEQALQFLEQGFTLGRVHDLQLVMIWNVPKRGGLFRRRHGLSMGSKFLAHRPIFCAR